MTVLFLSSYFYPESAASSYIGDNIREELAKNGIDVVLYVPEPTRGVPDAVRQEYKHRRYEELYGGRLRVFRFRMFKEGHNPIFRAFRYFICCIKQLNHSLFSRSSRNCSVVFSSSTPPIQGTVAALVSSIRRMPFVYDLQDIFPDSMAGTGLAKRDSILWKIGRKIEDYTYRHANRIIVISEDFKKNIMAKGVPEEKIVVIYNWVDQNAVVDIPQAQNKLFDIYGLDRDKFYLCYSGNIGLTQNMDMLLEVMGELRVEYPDIHLILVGDGAYKQQVEAIVDRDGLTNVHLIPFQPYEDISYVFSLGDVGLVISKPGVGANSVPSKTWSIMSASRPVLASFDENELKDIISDNKCGIFTKAGDKNAFKDSIISLYNDKSLCLDFGKNGRKFVMGHLTREVGTQRYVDVIKEFDRNEQD